MLNRVIGILVVLAIGVLVYPFVFHSQDLGGHTDGIRLPPFPSPQTQNATIQALSQGEAPEGTAAQLAKLNPIKKKVTLSKDKKHVKPGSKNVAWVIQVGTFREKVTALTLVNQLRAKGYNAFIHQTNAAFGEEVQVYIGPELKKETAAILASKLSKETKLSGVVKTYKLLSA